MQGVSFPDINKTPTSRASRRPAGTRRSPAPRGSRSGGSEDDDLPDTAASVIWCKSSTARRKTRPARTRAR
jgi:hypothetical protein